MIKIIQLLNKRPKLSKKVWISEKEIRVYKSKVVGLFEVSDHANSINFTCDRIIKLFKNGHNFAFLYLKECLRLTINFIAGTPETVGPGKGIIVARDHRGLPMIIDSTTRQLFVEGKKHRLLVTAYLTLISVFRVFPTKVAPKLDTIVSEFTGLSRSLDPTTLRAAIIDLLGKRFEINMAKPTLIKLEKAHPNGTKSSWGASLDALGFGYDLNRVRAMGEYHKLVGDRRYCFGVIALMLLGYPLMLIFKYCWTLPRLHMGRLGVVYDQAGKARVIGITNYWIQLSLKPLHDSIFRLLKKIDSDGTFDQTRKLFELTKIGKKFHCFDLSAATDRLPIDIQRDILNILKPDLGNRWADLLDLPGFYKDQVYKYSVGQPMGAYSSGAMLAITHHVIVKVAALRVGIKKFTDYCVLGDDIIICNDDVAPAYLSIMETLGVSINLSKSVVSNDIAEFAKRGVGPDIDITPIGPGLILRYIRSPYYVGAVLNECVRLKIIDNFPKLLMMVKSCPVKDQMLAIWSTVGLGSYWVKMYGDTNNVISYALSSCNNPDLFRYSLYEALSQLRLDEGRNSNKKLIEEDRFAALNYHKIFSSNKGPLIVIELWLKLVGPGPGIYASSFEETYKSFESFPKPGSGSFDDIKDLAHSLEEINTSSIDGTQKKKVKSCKESIKKLNFYFERARSEAEIMFSPHDSFY